MIFFFSKLYLDFQLMENWIDAPDPQIVQGSAVFGKEFKVRAKLQEKEEYIHVHLLLTLCLICFVFPHTLSVLHTHTHTHTHPHPHTHPLRHTKFFPQTHTRRFF